MTPKNRKNGYDWLIYSSICLSVVYFALVLSFAMRPGYIITDFMERLNTVVLPELEQSQYGLKDFGVYGRLWSDYSAAFMAAAFFACFIICFYLYAIKRNYIAGKEYGTASYANVFRVNRILRDPGKDKSKIYTVTQDERTGKDKKHHFVKKAYTINTNERRISENLYFSLNTRHTDLNNNTLVLGGSGSGKSFRYVKPNVLQMQSSFVFTDPKGELLLSTAAFLKTHGYVVKVLNLLDANGMKHSNHYNPFTYIHTDTDVIQIVTNMMANTTKKDAVSSDPFWENAESMLLQALIFYIMEVVPPNERNFRKLMYLLSLADCKENRGTRIPSELDNLFSRLEAAETLRIKQETEDYNSGRRKEVPSPMSPAVVNYNSVMRGAADTVRSIIISAKARLSKLNSEDILSVLDDDEMNIRELGLGANEDGKTKTALYCVIPDNDKSYNFIIGMLYSQMFVELYHAADFECDGHLPLHVSFMLDEFANVALPDDFCSLLSTMRSRNINANIIIQNMAQLKALFKDTWETIPGNCDTFIYLGGNEQSTHEYVSKMMGKATYAKRTTGVTHSRQGSSSQNEDVIGRELMLPDEVRKCDGKKCIVLIRGFDPIFDDKIKTNEHPLFALMDSVKYVHHPENDRQIKGIHFAPKTMVDSALRRDENGISSSKLVLSIDGESLLATKSTDIPEMLGITEDSRVPDVADFEVFKKLLSIKHKQQQKKEKEEASQSTVQTSGQPLLINKIRQTYGRDAALGSALLLNKGFRQDQIEAALPAFEKGFDAEYLLQFINTNMTLSDISDIVSILTEEISAS